MWKKNIFTKYESAFLGVSHSHNHIVAVISLYVYIIWSLGTGLCVSAFHAFIFLDFDETKLLE